MPRPSLVRCLFAAMLLVSAMTAHAVSTTVVISQFQLAGGTAADEFVELHNVSSSPVDLNGYRLVYRSATGTTDATTLAAWTSSTIIPAGGYYLVAHTSYDGTPAADKTFNFGATGSLAAAGGGLALRNGAVNTGTIIDSVGFGTATNAFVEGTKVAAPAANASAARGSNGCSDTDDNAADFSILDPSVPRSSATAVSLCVAPLPTLTINDVTLAETNAGTRTFTFTVSLSAPAGAGGVTFDIATADSTATTADNDYVARSLSGQTIPSGSSTYSFDVTVNGDVAIEATETFFVNVTNITGATAADTQGVGTITDDDSPLPTLSINDVAAVETNAGTTTFTFTVSLSAAATAPVTFDVATANGTATTADNDYVAKSVAGQTIAIGSSTSTFTVAVNGDTTPESHETFLVNVTNLSGATAADTQGQGTITNDDVTLAVNDVTASEGNSGTKTFSFTVTATGEIATSVGFDIATADDTATVANNDYVTRSLAAQTITAPASSATFDVTVNGDTTFEGSERFFVNLTNATGATISDAQGVGTITDDDASSITIADLAITEGAAGTQTATFTVTASPAAPVALTVDYATADDSATAAADYASATGQISFAAGETTKAISITINGDATPEGNEQFFVNLSNATAGATIGDAQALGVIRDDDPRPITAVDTAFTTDFATLATTGTSATTPIGWTFSESGSASNATYAAGTGSDTAGNTYSFGAAAAADRALGTLLSGSNTPTIGSFFVNNTGTAITTLTIAYTGEQWRCGATGRDDRLDFQYSLDAASLATGTWVDVDTLDFSTIVKTAVTALDGNLPANRRAIQATIAGLSIPPGATFWIRWNDYNASGSDDGLAVDDFSITANITGILSIADAAIDEGDSGTKTLTFTITRSDPAPVGGTSVDVSTADNTATVADNDYVALPLTTVTIPAGQTTATVDVTIKGDMTPESPESFFVNLTNPVNGAIIDAQAVGTIWSDDLTFTAINAIQGNGNQSPRNGETLTVAGVVTGIKSGGFFVQAPDAEADADPTTSEGIYVYTGATIPAGVAIGNRVAATGTVTEYPPASAPHTLTELAGTVVVNLLATGQPLPTPVTIAAADGQPSTNFSQYEKYEAMRVAATLAVTTPTGGSTDEANATGSSNGVFYGVIDGVARPLREPGIPVGDTVPSDAPAPASIPRFDENPERIRVASTSQPGATQLNVATGQKVSLVGVLDYGFLEYSLLPEAATPAVITGSAAFSAVPAPLASELTAASLNFERFFDDVNDPAVDDAVLTAAAYNKRLAKASLAIRNVLRNPDVLGVVEVENLPVLEAIATKVNTDAAGAVNYVAYLVEGNDIGGIDVGFLVNTARVTVSGVTQVGKAATYVDPTDSTAKMLNDRPPLVLDATIPRTDGSTYAFTVVVNHLRSLNGAEEDSANGRRVRAKRAAQAEFLADYVQSRQTADPNVRIVLVGDFNAFEFNDGLVDVINTIKGTPAPASTVVRSSTDRVDPDLVNLVELVPQEDRYSFVFDGNLQVLDHALATQAARSTFTRAAFAHFDAGFPEIFRGDATRPERLSDHDAIVAYFNLLSAGALQFSAPTYTVSESATTFNVTVTRSGGSAGAVSASYSIAAGTADPADFTAATGTISFADGELSKTFAVTINDDVLDEPDQTIVLSLSSPLGGATIGAQSTATLTIVDDDNLPSLSIDDVTVNEGASGTTTATLTVTLAGSTSNTVTVAYATADGTAVAPLDYTASTGTLTFAPGVTTQQITIAVNGDSIYERAETLLVNLSNATNAAISDAQGVVTISNDDPIAVADLVVTTALDPARPFGGQNVTMTVTVRNNGPADATEVALAAQIPAGMTLVSVSSTQGTCTAGNPVSCAVGTLANGTQAEISLVLTSPSTGGQFDLMFSVSAFGTDPTPVADQAASVVVAPLSQIPTLSEWVLLLLAFALAALGAMKLRV